jgi:hypothetical protein
MSREGVLMPTWEGELIRGGFTDGSGTMGNSFHFTVENGELISLAIKCMNDQSEIAMDYECELIASIARSESSHPHFVKGIKVIK